MKIKKFINSIQKHNPVSRIVNFKNKIKNIYNVLNNIEISCSGNTTYIKIPEHMVLCSKGNMLIYSEDGVLVTKHKRTHINPDITFEVKDSTAEIAKRALEKRILLEKQNAFLKLLEKKKIYTK